MFVLIPTAEVRSSASKTSCPLAVFTNALTPFPVCHSFSTEEFVIMLIPDFFIERSICFEISSSSTGTTFGMNSTTVTSSSHCIIEMSKFNPNSSQNLQQSSIWLFWLKSLLGGIQLLFYHLVASLVILLNGLPLQ